MEYILGNHPEPYCSERADERTCRALFSSRVRAESLLFICLSVHMCSFFLPWLRARVASYLVSWQEKPCPACYVRFLKTPDGFEEERKATHHHLSPPPLPRSLVLSMLSRGVPALHECLVKALHAGRNDIPMVDANLCLLSLSLSRTFVLSIMGMMLFLTSRPHMFLFYGTI